MLRGINRQDIFIDEQDKEKFLQTLKHYKDISGYKIFAYCIMSNHLHLLIKPEKEKLDLILKRIAGSYVYWYNWKYKRTGHLFQDRFKSEPVDSNEYFLTVLRYIHQNPIKSGLCKHIADYKYSSYNYYLKDNSFVDCDLCFEIIDKSQFVQFHNENNSDLCLDIEENNFRLTDEEAADILQKISGCKNVVEFQKLDVKMRDKYLKLCRQKGISIRQLSRLTGVSFNIIRKFK
ncbi:MAG: transposase [Clostridia bacterium]|nr:transposase [Clostridia bacterium]